VSVYSALSPVFGLVIGLFVLIRYSDLDLIRGPSQILLVGLGLFSLFGDRFWKRRGKSRTRWISYFSRIRLQILENLKNIQTAVWILFLVGILIAAWSQAGILQNLILLGLDLLKPGFFLVGVALGSAIVSLSCGSSWSTAGTVGLAFLGVGQVWGFPNEWTVGAILSGAYFGDKLSPLSDTTNLASGVSKVPLGDHIRFMLPTSAVSFALSLVIFYYLGGNLSISNTESGIEYSILADQYPIFLPNLLVPLLVIFSVSLGIPAIPGLGFGILAGGSIAGLYHQIPAGEILESFVFGFQSNLNDPDLDELLSGGGLVRMLPTVFLILSAMVFGGCMEASGRMAVITQILKRKIHSTQGLILSTMGFSFFTNLTSSDQYLSLVIPGRTLRNTYLSRKIDTRILARALEDSGTLTSVMIPWNSCGAFMSSTLLVSTWMYIPFCFYHWIQIGIAICLTFVLGKKKKSSNLNL
jgi:NhaC family Na+:H+ antiporter